MTAGMRLTLPAPVTRHCYGGTKVITASSRPLVAKSMYPCSAVRVRATVSQPMRSRCTPAASALPDDEPGSSSPRAKNDGEVENKAPDGNNQWLEDLQAKWMGLSLQQQVLRTGQC